jgi:nucleotide-binding universal stress UspA family protein
MNIKKILVPVDGSEASKIAAERAVELARKCGSEITFMIVVELKSDIAFVNSGRAIIDDEYYSVVSTMIDLKTKRDTETLDKMVEGLDCSDLKTERLVLVGDARQQIVETAEQGGFDMIIMGHRGMNPIKRFFLGSVAKKVIEDAPCSVLVVK